MNTADGQPLVTEQLTQDEAMNLFHKTASCLCLDVPPRLEVGIDMRSWQIGAKFKGIKFIPPGFHFIYWRFVYFEILLHCRFLM